jgi:hypothetical protein
MGIFETDSLFYWTGENGVFDVSLNNAEKSDIQFRIFASNTPIKPEIGRHKILIIRISVGVMT